MARVVVHADDVGQPLGDRERVTLIACLPPLRQAHGQRDGQKAVHQNWSGWIGLSGGLDFVFDECRIQPPGVLHAEWIDSFVLNLPGDDAGVRLVAIHDTRDELGRGCQRAGTPMVGLRPLGQRPRQVVAGGMKNSG